MKIKAHALFHYVSTKKSLLYFWGVIFSLMLLNIFLSIQISAGGTQGSFVGVQTFSPEGHYSSMMGVGLIAVPIFMIVGGISAIPDSFGHLLSMGSTRKACYLGVMLSLGVVALFMSVIQTLAFYLETGMYALVGWNHLPVTVLFGSVGVTGLFTFGLLFFSMLVLLAALFNLAAAFFYRINNKLILFGTGAVLLLSLFNRGTGALLRGLWRWLFGNPQVIQMSWKLLLLSAICFAAGWGFMGKAEVKGK